MERSMQRSCFILVTAAFLGCAHAPNQPPVNYGAIVAESDRTPEDRALDAGRHPAQLLELTGVRPGMHVAELCAGRGYTTELLARAVAPTGAVYGQNPETFLKFAGEDWVKRLARPVNKNVVRVDLPLESPFPAEAHDLDMVLANLVYHDFVWLGVDRAAMNKAVLASLRPGGTFIIVDHATAKGRGIEDVKTLHRIDEDTVIAELTQAGFKLERRADFLHNPQDPHDWNASPSSAGEQRGSSDRFALRFVKP